MENASKAILIAGGVLIAMVLLTFFVYLFNQMGSSTKSIYSMLEESEITEFNQQFYNYDTERSGKILNVQDVATLINLAMDNNKTQKLPTEITVMVDGNNLTDSSYEAWLSEKTSSDSTYKCKVTATNKLVSKVVITSINQ